MSCWVVPSLAAEIWGVSLEHVLEFIRHGLIATHADSGWTFVDVAPAGNKPPPTEPPPPTYTVVSDTGILALSEEPPDEPGPEAGSTGTLAAGQPAPTEVLEDEAGPIPLGEEEESPRDIRDWRAARSRAGAMRVPPGRR